MVLSLQHSSLPRSPLPHYELVRAGSHSRVGPRVSHHPPVRNCNSAPGTTEEIHPQKSLARYARHDEPLVDGLGKHFQENLQPTPNRHFFPCCRSETGTLRLKTVE